MDKLEIAREALGAIVSGWLGYSEDYIAKYGLSKITSEMSIAAVKQAIANHAHTEITKEPFDPREYAGTDPGPDSSKLWDVYMMTHVISEDRSPLALLEGFWHWLDGNGKLK